MNALRTKMGLSSKKSVSLRAAVVAAAVMLASCQQSVKTKEDSNSGYIRELQLLSSRPSDVEVGKKFKVASSTPGRTGEVRIFNATMPGQRLVDSVKLIRGAGSEELRQISIKQIAAANEGDCLTMTKVSQSLGLFVQPPEPTPVYKSEGQSAYAIGGDESVEISAVAESSKTDCVSEITFQYRQ